MNPRSRKVGDRAITLELALFELKEDSRPKSERRASGRYEAPTMLELMRRE